ncbi:MAG TPA: arsenic resistance N-acetyltransferase ArsN2 [bacterium]|nr:arsenic resistance N-acetyltransferase ArsN2 [bacterium]
MPVVRVRSATPDDFAGVERLLSDVDLTTAGVSEHFDAFIVAEDDPVIVGCAGLETYGVRGLLRSVAVRADYRGATIGRQLVERALDHARESGVREIYLLTNTAAVYFTRLGFEPIERSQVDPTVQQSQEFSTESCDSATVMRLTLGPRGVNDDSQ